MKNNWLHDHSANIYSQFGEDGIINKILSMLPETNSVCIDIGAHDGITCSNTRNIIFNENYVAILIECNKKRFEELTSNYKNNQNVHCINEQVGFNENNLDLLLNKYDLNVPVDFDFLSIDIDGNDYHIWGEINNYQPKLVCCEFNPSIPNQVDFVQEENMNVNHGCSILSLNKLAQRKGYELIAMTQNNAFFIDRKYFNDFNIVDNSIEQIRDDFSSITYIFQGYDGKIFLRGYGKFIWHGYLKIREKSIQDLPKIFRVDRYKMNSIINRLFNWYKNLRKKV